MVWVNHDVKAPEPVSPNKPERIDYKNPDGYADPTPYNALRNMQRDSADINAMRLIKCILTLLDLNGYTLIGRLNIRDRLTGREYN